MKDLTKSVEALFAKGAKHVVLFTVANPKKSPSWLFSSDQTRFEEEKAEWRKTVALHNNTLRQKYSEMGARYGRQVSLFELDAIIDEISGETNMDFDRLWKDEFGKRNYDAWMQQAAFFDPAHPTTKVQCVIASKLLDHLQNAGIVSADAKWLNRATTCEQRISALSKPTSTSTMR
jgi:phospholipase/lecithinase/hemolysin